MTANPTGPTAIMAVAVQAGTTFRAGTPLKLFEGEYRLPSSASVGRNYDVSPDGRRFLITKTSRELTDASTRQLIVVQNWTEELKRLVPSP